MGILFDLTRGAAAGAAATWLMDAVTTQYLKQQPETATAQEEAVRPKGQHAVDNLVDLIQERTGMEISDEQRPMVTQAIHYGLGVVPGALYAVVRKRVPLVGATGGLLYGFALWALMDEYVNTRLGLVAQPDAYPAAAHGRGLVGHLVLGAGTDTILRVIPG
jgi:uncharacterized membrane protein YagU involved in acid resistance